MVGAVEPGAEIARSSERPILLEARAVCRDVAAGERLAHVLERVLAGTTVWHRRFLDRVSLRVREGELLAVIGPSGCGKSTLLRALAAGGRAPFTSGRVLLAGVDLYQEQRSLRRAIAFLPQSDVLHEELTVGATIAHGARLRGVQLEDTNVEEYALELLRRVKLLVPGASGGELLSQRVSTLSGGQRKRLQLAVELSAQPVLLLADEITSGLDPELDAEVMDLLRELARSGVTVVCVTHNHRHLDRCDRVAVVDRGRLVALGAPGVALAAYERIDPAAAPAEPLAAPEGDPPQVAARPQPRRRPGLFEEIGILSARMHEQFMADRVGLRLYVVQVVAVGAAIALVFGGPVEGSHAPRAAQASFVLAIAAFWVGFVQSVFELVRERAVYQRERALGMRAVSYVLSKWLALLPLAWLPVAILLFWSHWCVPALGDAVGPPLFALLALATVGVSGGLAASSAMREPRWAVAALFVTMMVQIIFSGIFALEAGSAAHWTARFLSAQHWGWQALLGALGLPDQKSAGDSQTLCYAALGAMAAAGAAITLVMTSRREP